MRSWGIMHVDDLTEWLRSHGLPATRPRWHFTARAQEFILQEKVQDGRTCVGQDASHTKQATFGETATKWKMQFGEVARL